jgi:LPS export ABC transporter protein LptC
MKNRKNKPAKLLLPAFCSLFSVLVFPACSFDYGDAASDSGDQPDIVMKDVEYVRMRDGYPVVRFTAEEAQRFEKKQAMELGQFKFEQFETRAESVSVTGSAGLASIELDSGNIHMKGGVSIEVESEDLAISTTILEWQDKERLLFTGEADRVDILRSDGTSFTGWGFSADARRRSWEFKNGVEGTYVEKDEDEEGEAEGPAGAAEDGSAAENAAAGDITGAATRTTPEAAAETTTGAAARDAAGAAARDAAEKATGTTAGAAARDTAGAAAGTTARDAAGDTAKTEKAEKTGEADPENLPAVTEGAK